MDFTRKFSVLGDKDAEIRHILTTVYNALREKGYNPINQIVGYILSVKWPRRFLPICPMDRRALFRYTVPKE